MTNVFLDKQISFRFRVRLCRLGFQAQASGLRSHHSVALTTAHAKPHAHLAIARHAHVRPRPHTGFAVDEFGKALLAAQVALAHRVHDLARHGAAFDLNVLHSVTFCSQVTGLRCIQFTTGS